MVLDWKGIPYIPTNTLSGETSLAQNDNGLYLADLAALLNRHGFQTEPTTSIRASIDSGRPCLCLVKYGYLSSRQQKSFTGLHYVLAVGYDEVNVRVMDPDFYSPIRDQGINHLYPWSEWNLAFLQAIAIL